jgi:hypothetical protein
MTSKRDLGPILAVAGAAIAMIAVIVGFIIIGGPGDARDKRIDHGRLAEIALAAGMASCVYSLTGEAPASLAEAFEVTARISRVDRPNSDCAGFTHGPALSSAPDAEYRKIDASHVEVCQTFVRAESDPPRYNDPNYPDVFYMNGPFNWPELSAPRPTAGRFCYALDLNERVAALSPNGVATVPLPEPTDAEPFPDEPQ